MKRQLMHAAAAACLVATAGPALAEAGSGAVFRDLVISLTDLDPHDGIEPSLAFQFMGPSYATSVAEGKGDVHDTSVKIRYAAQQEGQLTAATTTDWSFGTGSIALAPTLAGATAISAIGAAYSGLDAWGTYTVLASGAASANQFVLSPNTRMTISADTEMWAHTTMGYNLDADMAELATARVLLSLVGTVDGTMRIDDVDRTIEAGFDIRDDNTTVGVDNSWRGLLSVDLVNDSDAQATGIFQAIAQADGYSAVWDGVTPVPEPATYGMLLGGLVILGMIARRRRR